MRKLALSDSVLMRVEKPERYIGGEWNSVIKDKNNVDIRFAFAFPDVYEVGMSHLGIQVLYDMFNKMDGVWCERVYSPWVDLDKIMREENIPLFALESQESIKSFDFLGITLQYEMCYPNVLQMIELSGIPLHSEDRGEDDPIVVGGGPCSYNPEPIYRFFDMFCIGEGEEIYPALFALYRQCKNEGVSRAEFLIRAASLPGIYVPSLYNAEYDDNGMLSSFYPINERAPEKVKRQIVTDFEHAPYPDKPIVPYIQAIQDRVTLEIQRGCIRGCRFCQAGFVYRPLREKPVEHVKELADEMIKSTGYDEISLSSLSSSDYEQLPELLEYLMKICPGKGINISLPSLRIDSFSLDVMSKIQDIKKSSLTFAPEAGSQRMRNVINKGLTEENILNGAAEAFKGGWNKVKLYFMLGLPGETEDDIKEIAHLCEKTAMTYYDTVPKEKRNGKAQITASSSFFVPKPFTPFQWASMNKEDEFREKARIVKAEVMAQLNQKSIRYKYHDPDESVLEGVLARGDRRVADVVETVYKKGALFDAWSDQFVHEYWIEAFKETGIDPYFYTNRERSVDELLPWDFIDIGVSKEFMIREWERAKEAIVTPNCRMQCMGCGANKFGGGICYENKN